MVVERGVTWSGELGFSDDELGEMGAAVQGSARRKQSMMRVPFDEVPRLAGPRTLPEIRVIDDNGLTSTVRQAAFDPVDVLVDTAFDGLGALAAAPPAASSPPAITAPPPAGTAPPPAGTAPPPAAPAPLAVPQRSPAPFAALSSPVASVIVADEALDWTHHDGDGIEPIDHPSPPAKLPAGVPAPLAGEVSLPRSTPAMATPALVISPGPGAAASSDAITSKQRIIPTPPESIPAAVTSSNLAGSQTLVSMPPPPSRATPSLDKSEPAMPPVSATAATPAVSFASPAPPALRTSPAIEQPPPASAATRQPVTSPPTAPPPIATPAAAVSPPALRVNPPLDRPAERPPAPASAPVERPRRVDEAVYSSAPPPDAAILMFNTANMFTASVVVANVTPRRDLASPIALSIAASPVAAPAPEPNREEDGEELDGVELEEVHPPVAAAPATPPPPVDGKNDRARRAPPPPPPAVTPAVAISVNPGAATPPTAQPTADASPEPPEPRGRRKRRSKPWYEELFDDDWLKTLPYLDAAQTRRESDFIASALGLDSASTLLDLACGNGRHAVDLATRGHTVTGLDLSLPLLIRAADAARREGVTVDFVHGDMRELTFDGKFDAAYCFFSSFGYFEDEINRNVVAQVAKALKPGGRFLIDLVNRDYIIGELPARVWWQSDGCMVLEEVDFNYYGSRIQSRRSVVFEDGRQLEHDVSIRSYSLHEIGKLLHGAGFRVTEVSGGLAQKGRFFGTESRQILIVAEKK